MIDLECPVCGVSLAGLAGEHARGGRSLKCRDCGARVDVPSLECAGTIPEAPLPPIPRQAPRPAPAVPPAPAAPHYAFPPSVAPARLPAHAATPAAAILGSSPPAAVAMPGLSGSTSSTSSWSFAAPPPLPSGPLPESNSAAPRWRIDPVEPSADAPPPAAATRPTVESPAQGSAAEATPPAIAETGGAAPVEAAHEHRYAGVGGLTSMLVHTVLFLVLALVMTTPRDDPSILVLTGSSDDAADQAELEELDAFEPEALEMTVEEMEVPQPTPAYEALAAGPETPDPEASFEAPVEFDATSAISATTLMRAVGGGGTATRGSGLPGGDVLMAAFAQRLSRAGAKTGDVQISLLWNNFNDIDLHVICPSGERIYFEHRGSRCRGMLDVDMNASGRESREPVENIFWPAGKAPFGKYAVAVHHYANHGDPDPTPFRVMVKVDGRVKTFSGELTFGQPPQVIHTFERKKGTPGDPFGGEFPL